MALSNKEIFNELEGNIIIEPFISDQLGSNSYDVTLGPFYYKHPFHQEPGYLSIDNGPRCAKYWNANSTSPNYGAEHARKITEAKECEKYGVNKGDEIIILSPGELILCHTNEYVGTRNYYTTTIQSKSTCGRIGLTICKDASCGSIGYVNRWTLEVENHSKSDIVLKVGQRIAQIIFWRTGPCTNDYSKTGSYKDSEWTPLCMLPSPASKYIKDIIQKEQSKNVFDWGDSSESEKSDVESDAESDAESEEGVKCKCKKRKN
jgi:dCTP deaminase